LYPGCRRRRMKFGPFWCCCVTLQQLLVVVVLLATLLLLQTCPRIRRGRLDCQEIPMYYADMMESKSTESKDGDFRP
jgi:hypothetical protein